MPSVRKRIPMAHTSFRIDYELMEIFREYCFEKKMSISQQVEKIIKEFLREEVQSGRWK